ncbi:MAG: hypothetical protein AAGH89_05290 [Verrucomicrobiota bacterium]
MSIPDHNFSRKDGDPHRIPDAATARFLEVLGFQAGVLKTPTPQNKPSGETYYVLCPGCHEELSIGRANFGTEGPCPTCGTRIIAGQDGDGNVRAKLAGQFCPPPSLLGWPPKVSGQNDLEGVQATKSTRSVPEKNLVRMEYLVDPSEVKPATVRMRGTNRKRRIVGIGIAASLILGGFSLFLIGQSTGDRDPEAPLASSPSEEAIESPSMAKVSNESIEPQTIEPAFKADEELVPAPTISIDPVEEQTFDPVTEFVPNKPMAIGESSGPTRAELGEATVRAFLSADRLEGKSHWILNPEKNSHQLRDFYFLEPLAHQGEPQINHVETRQADRGQWISLFDVIQPVSLPHRVLIVHQANGAAKVDFGLYRQMRENALHRFLAGPDQGSTREFRVMVRQTDQEVTSISENFKEPALFFEVRLPFYSGAPGVVAVPVDSPVLEELQSAFYRNEGDLAAVVELKWQPSEVDPHEWVVTISRLVRLGLWD